MNHFYYYQRKLEISSIRFLFSRFRSSSIIWLFVIKCVFYLVLIEKNLLPDSNWHNNAYCMYFSISMLIIIIRCTFIMTYFATIHFITTWWNNHTFPFIMHTINAWCNCWYIIWWCIIVRRRSSSVHDIISWSYRVIIVRCLIY